MGDSQDVLHSDDRVLKDHPNTDTDQGTVTHVVRLAIGVLDAVQQSRAESEEAWARDDDPVRASDAGNDSPSGDEDDDLSDNLREEIDTGVCGG